MNISNDEIKVPATAAVASEAASTVAVRSATADEQTLAVIAEDVIVRTVERDTGAVRVRIEARERPERASAPVVTAKVEVERIPRRQVVSETRAPWHDGDVLVVPVYRDEVVQVRQLVLVEEIRLHTYRETETRQIDVTVREEQAIVERQGPDGVWRAVVEGSPTGGSDLREEQAG